MPRLTKSLPSYRLHKTSGQAVVALDGRDFYLGLHGSQASRAEYDRLVGEWLAQGRRLPPAQGRPPELTVDELILRYWEAAQGNYTRDGIASRELENICDAPRHVRPLYGRSPAAEFGPLAQKAVRRAMVEAGLSRTTINARMGKIRRMFKWAVGEELVPAAIYQGLLAVEGLRAGRDGVREPEPVMPIPDEHVTAVLPHVSAPIRAMIELQSLTATRPGEVMATRACDIDRSESDRTGSTGPPAPRPSTGASSGRSPSGRGPRRSWRSGWAATRGRSCSARPWRSLDEMLNGVVHVAAR